MIQTIQTSDNLNIKYMKDKTVTEHGWISVSNIFVLDRTDTNNSE